MEWIKYELKTTTSACDAIGGLLEELGVIGYEIRDNVPLSPADEKKMFTDIPATLPPDNGEAVIVFYGDMPETSSQTVFSTGSSLRDADLMSNDTGHSLLSEPEKFIQRFLERIENQNTLSAIPRPEITYTIEDDSAWKDKWKENFKPFWVADDILIKPTWENVPEDCNPSDIIVSIDPGSAFGTGTHETTKLCLLSLRKYINERTRLLDAGCGSGILAITALLCGADSAFCLDIDSLAVEGSIENARINGIAPERFTAIQANILEDADTIRKQTGEPFDVAVANILADVIIPLSEKIGDFMKPGGIFISSGILAEKADDVETALTANHFQILDKNILGDWVAFIAKKPQH
ncbi:MAG: 50S ribosomal protein L11 methyltransferase [Lachnospiraceae bacterium]|nr:50S ribosomal protein L11 methyltransferase [Lachnospiraceae bacterium]